MSEPTGDAADVLLVEDNPGDIRLIHEAFAGGDIDTTVHVVSDGIEALDFCFRRGEHENAPRPDIILLDLNLPRKDGEEVLGELKAAPDLRTLPIVVITGSAVNEEIVGAYERGANAYLTKPVDPNTFLETMQAFKTFWLSVAQLPDPSEEPS